MGFEILYSPSSITSHNLNMSWSCIGLYKEGIAHDLIIVFL